MCHGREILDAGWGGGRETSESQSRENPRMATAFMTPFPHSALLPQRLYPDLDTPAAGGEPQHGLAPLPPSAFAVGG